MIKKLQILLLLLFVISLQLAAQHSRFELSYQSFRPFVHFQLNFDNHGYDYRNAYESAYLKGYMDGVNSSYYYRHRFDDLVYDINAYESGYNDGFRDQALLISLRGRHWYKRHRFAYDDYYSPSYSVRIWLDGLSLAFLQAPAYRLPRRWKHRAHPHVKHYRKYMAKRRHHRGYDDYYSSANVERRFKKRTRSYQRHAKAHNVKKRHRKNVNRARGQFKGRKFNKNHSFKSNRGKKVNRSRTVKRNNRGRIHKQESKRRKAIKKSNNKKRKRGTVTRRGGKNKSKSKRSRSKGNRDRKRGNG